MKIEVKNVSKKFKNNYVVENANCVFESGKIYGLYGRNGSGKSVFLKMLVSFYNPTSGEVLFDGLNYQNTSKYPKNVGVLIEHPSFFGDLSGFKNLKILARIQNIINDKDIELALKIVNLLDEKNKKYKEYSLGMRQKLGIAQAIMENPDVIILDEPFNGIERVSVEKITNYLKEERDRGKLIIVSSHIKDDLKKMCDEFLYFDAGKVSIRSDLDEI